MTTEARRTCFVVGPIGSAGTDTRRSADFLLKGIIRPAIEESLNLKIWRADEDHQPGMITDKVISDIYGSNLVIADLSELNPNVFYELGIRHSASLPTIHMAASGTKLPFDNLGHRVIFFDRSDWDDIENAKMQLRSQATLALSTGFEVSNPVTQALSARAFRASAKPTEKVLADIMDRVAKLEGLDDLSLGGRDDAGDKWEVYQANDGWRWRRFAPNGRIVGASSAGFTNRDDCIANARRNGMP